MSVPFNNNMHNKSQYQQQQLLPTPQHLPPESILPADAVYALKSRLRTQVEFYLSEANLMRDNYLCSLLNSQEHYGAVPVHVICKFRKVREIYASRLGLQHPDWTPPADAMFVCRAVQGSSSVQVSPDGRFFIPMRGGQGAANSLVDGGPAFETTTPTTSSPTSFATSDASQATANFFFAERERVSLVLMDVPEFVPEDEIARKFPADGLRPSAITKETDGTWILTFASEEQATAAISILKDAMVGGSRFRVKFRSTAPDETQREGPHAPQGTWTSHAYEANARGDAGMPPPLLQPYPMFDPNQDHHHHHNQGLQHQQQIPMYPFPTYSYGLPMMPNGMSMPFGVVAAMPYMAPHSMYPVSMSPQGTYPYPTDQHHHPPQNVYISPGAPYATTAETPVVPEPASQAAYYMDQARIIDTVRPGGEMAPGSEFQRNFPNNRMKQQNRKNQNRRSSYQNSNSNNNANNGTSTSSTTQNNNNNSNNNMIAPGEAQGDKAPPGISKGSQNRKENTKYKKNANNKNSAKKSNKQEQQASAAVDDILTDENFPALQQQQRKVSVGDEDLTERTAVPRPGYADAVLRKTSSTKKADVEDEIANISNRLRDAQVEDSKNGKSVQSE